jgi:hypothetical protein
VEALLKDAYALKKGLENQKEALIGRLKGVTSILEADQHTRKATTSYK